MVFVQRLGRESPSGRASCIGYMLEVCRVVLEGVDPVCWLLSRGKRLCFAIAVLSDPPKNSRTPVSLSSQLVKKKRPTFKKGGPENQRVDAGLRRRGQNA